MNRQIVRLFGVIVLLFATLVGFTTWWTTVKAEDLENQAIDGQRVNQRPLLEQQQIPRGQIYAEDGTRLASNRRRGSGETRVYTRRYPEGTLFGNPVGYSFIQAGDAGLERYYNDDLAGNRNEFSSLLDQLLGERKEGEDLHTSLDPQGQRAAVQALQSALSRSPRGAFGSVVAIEPDTGKVRVMADVPSFDPNDVPREAERGRNPGNRRENKSARRLTPPGSTFKVVTATAALDSGEYKPDTLIDGKNGKRISGVPLNNFGGTDYGLISLTDALTNSVNTVFAEVAEKIGDDELYKYMRLYGFEVRPPIDLPKDETAASGVFEGEKLVEEGEGADIGRVGIGQSGGGGEILATPLQMATVAATVANDGVRMKPRIGDRLVRPDGRIAERIRKEEATRVMKSETAAQLTAMMRNVVDEGTGTAAAVEGIDVAGKTGTAEFPNSAQNRAWFIGFAPSDDPKIAIAVTVQPTLGQGGTTAAPVASAVIRALIGNEASG